MGQIKRSHFSVNDLPASKRFEAFQESMSVCYDTANPTVAEERFHGEITSQLVDQILLVETKASGQDFIRSAKKIRRDGVDHFMVQTFRYGQTQRLDSDANASCDADKIIIHDAAEPWAATTAEFSNITLVIPRRLIAGKLKDENAHHAREIHFDNPLGKILFSYLKSLPVAIRELDEQAAKNLIYPGLDLLATVLNQFDGASPRSTQNKDCVEEALCKTRAMQIRQYIDQHLSDPDLTVGQIQQVFKLSRAHLYRIFPARDGIATYIRTRRLELAYRALQTSTDRVGQIAFSFGFASESTFRRVFKEAYGVSASEVQHSSAITANAQEVLSNNPARLLSEWFKKL